MKRQTTVSFTIQDSLATCSKITTLWFPFFKLLPKVILLRVDDFCQDIEEFPLLSVTLLNF